MNERPLVAWDVDKTLIDAGPGGGDIMDVAVSRTLDRVLEHGVRFGGKTDPRIAAEILAASDVPLPHDEHVATVLTHLEDVLRERAHLLAAQGRVLPGVRETLKRLHDLGAVQTVLTGNIRPNALVKISAFGLDEFLDLEVGAFGSDHASRPQLLPLVLERAALKYRRTWTPQQTWVVGDTEFDHECAAASGARCLLVATGSVDYDTLGTLGADAVRHDLSDADAVVSLLTGR
ncbi:MAG: haloacid dehalogenase-like hydrolase [Streptosporangiales bacterium]|nr:haloacid dehalogenase-like hydrolase [Streptosporangiales bacterium]MBO0890079.1 haloacid dehalogenase-like hydrolase [Acidothermales bacterium]